MPSITVKNIPDDLYEQLKRAAAAHHRSINSELIHCLEMTFRPSPLSATDLAETARMLRSRVDATLIDSDEINEAKTQGRE